MDSYEDTQLVDWYFQRGTSTKQVKLDLTLTNSSGTEKSAYISSEAEKERIDAVWLGWISLIGTSLVFTLRYMWKKHKL